MNNNFTDKSNKVGDQAINSLFGQLNHQSSKNKSSNKLPNKYSIQDTVHNIQYDGSTLSQSKKEFLQPSQTLEYNIPPKNLVVNKNTGVEHEDFPGMFNLPVPSPATIPNLGTGNGQGGQIIGRSQIKNASQNVTTAKNRWGQEFDDPDIDLSYRVREDLLPWAANKLHYLNPLGLTDTASKYGYLPGIAAGAATAGLTGLAAAWLHNKLADPVYKKDKNGKIVKDESANKSRYLAYGLGAATLGSILGSSYARDHINTKNNRDYLTKTSSMVKKAFPFPMNDQNVLFQLNQLINNDYTINLTQKNELINQLRMLPTSSINSFSPLLGAGIGGGIGYLIAKKLFNLGKTSTIIASILGATTGLLAGHNSQPNSIPMFDPFRFQP